MNKTTYQDRESISDDPIQFADTIFRAETRLIEALYDKGIIDEKEFCKRLGKVIEDLKLRTYQILSRK